LIKTAAASMLCQKLLPRKINFFAKYFFKARFTPRFFI
jgi:hypothetical protein